MLTFQKEKFADIEAELRGLVREHWEEVAANKDKVPLDPDWEKYRALDASGVLHVLTVRFNGEFVGYVIHILIAPLHYRTLITGHEDSHFLKREHRKGRAGLRMLDAADAMVKALGGKAVRYHTKARPDIDKSKVFERRGYTLIEHVYLKLLEN